MTKTVHAMQSLRSGHETVSFRAAGEKSCVCMWLKIQDLFLTLEMTICAIPELRESLAARKEISE
jgi:hypothetical protein